MKVSALGLKRPLAGGVAKLMESHVFANGSLFEICAARCDGQTNGIQFFFVIHFFVLCRSAAQVVGFGCQASAFGYVHGTLNDEIATSLSR